MSLPISEIEIVNQALIEIGRQPVTEITEETQDARVIQAKLELLLPVFLASTTWNFAVKYVFNNTPLTTPFSPDFQYAYQLPADYGRFWKFGTNVFPLVYQFTDGLLLTDIRPVAYYYIVNTVPFDVITPLFFRALALYVASDVAYILTNNEKLAAYLLEKYKDNASNAILLNDIERNIVTTPFNDFDRQVYI